MEQDPKWTMYAVPKNSFEHELARARRMHEGTNVEILTPTLENIEEISPKLVGMTPDLLHQNVYKAEESHSRIIVLRHLAHKVEPKAPLTLVTIPEKTEPTPPDAFEMMARDLREAQVQRRMSHGGDDESFWTETEQLITSQWLLFKQASQTYEENSDD